MPQTNDINISPHDIQSLNNRDAIYAFITHLGYDTNEPQKFPDPRSLGITTDSLVREIKSIEQLASNDGLLYVYLFELTSVTMAHTNALARAFRNKSGNYLFILTSDYERIDFVLLERSQPVSGDDSPMRQKANVVKPRTLTIDRKKPDRRQLRVLRRFTYTESDPIYQYDKLRSAYTIYEWSEDHFNNRALFSDYYLQERLRESDEWKTDVTHFYKDLRGLYGHAADAWSNKTKQDIEKGLYEKLFPLLGFDFTQKRKPGDELSKPDYELKATGSKNTLTVCLCYPWNRNLDGKDDPENSRDTETPDENPSATIVSVLKDDGVQWGIVTNGKLWRLYSAKASSIATTYYEIDLEEILASPQQLGDTGESLDIGDSLRYFYLFFRREAFEERETKVAGEKKTRSFLDGILDDSREYAKKLGERLKDRVFEEVFPYLAEGFIHHYKQKHGSKHEITQEQLDVVFQATLTLLYRILFLLYAEARDLLPVKEARGFYEISLTKLRNEIAGYAGGIRDEAEAKIKKQYNKTATDLYDRLVRLFRIIDRGDKNNNVPMYNGELFSSEPSVLDEEKVQFDQFLIDYKIPDYFLALGLDLITRDIDDKRHSLVFIDYKSLGVRHLGSIYEGLLEFKLRIAPQKMAIVRGKKTEEVVPYSEAKKDSKKKIVTIRKNGQKVEKVYSKGTLYLENDKRERKATGSYYTPDYIVKYIVENTVGPVLEEKFEKLAPEFRKAQQWHREQMKRKEDRKEVKTRFNLKAREAKGSVGGYRWLIDEFFDVNVLDPAMGSGHFLVEAVDFISDRMIHFLNGFRWNPVHVDLDDTRVTILEAMEKQGITIDSKKLDPNNLIRRYVLKRCIYGVDINPMAVELAKVSLWLNCFTLGAPLSFLDHHLKCGNSLIGVTVDEVRKAIEGEEGQTFNLFGGGFTGLMLATGLMRHVGELSDVTATQVEESKREYRKAEGGLAPFKRLLDVYTSQWFGNEPRKVGKGKSKREVNPAVEFLQTEISEKWTKEPYKTKLNGENKQLADTALQAVRDKSFFHWELEFPEVFYEKGGKKDDGGFDAVVGNPPWGAEFKNKELTFLFSKYKVKGWSDSYCYFMQISIESIVATGRSGMIVPSSWLTVGIYKELRNFIFNHGYFTDIIYLYRVFENVNLDQCVFIFKKLSTEGDCHCLIAPSDLSPNNRLKFIQDNAWAKQHYISNTIWKNNEDYRIDVQIDKDTLKIIDKIRKVTFPLSDVFSIGIGIQAYCKPKHTDSQIKNRIYHSNRKIDKTYMPCLSGNDVGRYIVNDIDVEYLSIGDWLYFKPEDKVFVEPRILAQQVIWKTLKTTLVEQINIAHYNSIFHIWSPKSNYSLEFINSILNSKLIAWLFPFYSNKSFGDKFPKLSHKDLSNIPVRRIIFNSADKLLKDGFSDLLDRYDEYIITGELSEILLYMNKEFIYHNQLDVIHKFLGYLANIMTELNKNIQSNVYGFLQYLEYNGIKCGVDNLSGKTIIKNFIGDYQKNESHAPFEDIVKVLQKNKSKLGVNLNQPGLLKELEREYEKSLEKLLPIKQRLALTDKLIDQIVYRLYGLTEEEIRVVEGE